MGFRDKTNARYGLSFSCLKLSSSEKVQSVSNFWAGGDQEHSWKPVTTGNTTSLDYWLNWRFSLCAGSVISSMIISFILIRRYEGLGQENKAESQRQMKQKETDHVGTVYDDDSWRPCLKYIHPAWLLAFRLTAFFVLSGLLTVYVSIEGTQTFYYYTQ